MLPLLVLLAGGLLLGGRASYARSLALPPYGWMPDTLAVAEEVALQKDTTRAYQRFSYASVSGGIIMGVGSWSPSTAFSGEVNLAWDEGWGVNVILSGYPLRRPGGRFQLMLPVKVGPSFTYMIPGHIALIGRVQGGVALDINPSFPSPVRPYLELGVGFGMRFLVNYPWNILLSTEALFLTGWALSGRAGVCYSW